MKDIEDETGKIPPRLVDINTEFARLVLSDLHVLNENDYEKAKAYLDNPAEFDFYNILDWHYEPSAMLRPV
jgi:6-phosphofructokinase 1